MALVDNQRLADRLTARLGVRVDCGLYRWIEDIRDPKTGRIVSQIVHDEGLQFKRIDGQPISQPIFDEEKIAAEADEAAALQADAARATRRAAVEVEAGVDVFIDRLRGAAPDQIKAWMDNNLAGVFTAQQLAFLKRVTVAVAYALNGGSSK